MKEEVTENTACTVLRDAPIITMSVDDPVPVELARRVGESMGLYDRPEHPFRMYAAAALG